MRITLWLFGRRLPSVCCHKTWTLAWTLSFKSYIDQIPRIYPLLSVMLLLQVIMIPNELFLLRFRKTIGCYFRNLWRHIVGVFPLAPTRCTLHTKHSMQNTMIWSNEFQSDLIFLRTSAHEHEIVADLLHPAQGLSDVGNFNFDFTEEYEGLWLLATKMPSEQRSRSPTEVARRLQDDSSKARI